MVPRLAIVLAALTLAAACSGDGDEVELADDERAGEVVAVEGRAVAERGGGEVALEVGDDVLAGDVLVTGEGAAITILLDHNDARWTLEGGKRRAVRASAAWRAPKASGGGIARGGDDRTAAAGRHAERQSADTRATATRVEPKSEVPERETMERAPIEETEAPPPAGAEAPPASTTEAPPPPPPPPRSKERRKRRPDRNSRGGGSSRSGGGGGDDIDALLENALGGDGDKKKAPSGSSGDRGEALTRADVVNTIRGARGAFDRCYEDAVNDDDTQRGKLRVSFVIAPTGKVTRADVEVTTGTFSAAMQGCIRKEFLALRFPRFSGSDKPVTYPLSFGE